MESKYRFDAKTVLGPAIRLEKKEDMVNAFQAACRNGHLLLAQWMAEAYDLDKDEAMAGGCLGLGLACKHGHLHVAQWLTAKFDLGKAHAAAGGHAAKRGSCANGHLEVVQWLSEQFKFTVQDIRIHDAEAFRNCCKNGHLATAKVGGMLRQRLPFPVTPYPVPLMLQIPRALASPLPPEHLTSSHCGRSMPIRAPGTSTPCFVCV